MSRAAAPPAAAPALALAGVGMTFGRTRVLHDVTFDVAAGERVALIGPNGAGKSTLFDVVSGRHAPSAGEVRLHGQRIDGEPAYRIARRGLARSFQVTHLFGGLSAFENLRCAALRSMGVGYAFWRRLSRLHAVNRRADELLGRLGLARRRDTPVHALAYAEQRALEIGVTVAGGADVILLDEPTAGMSRSETRRVVELIRELTAGRTLLMVEHDMGVVFDLADRVAVLVHGELAACDRPAAVRADARVQAAYLGSADGWGRAADLAGAGGP